MVVDKKFTVLLLSQTLSSRLGLDSERHDRARPNLVQFYRSRASCSINAVLELIILKAVQQQQRATTTATSPNQTT